MKEMSDSIEITYADENDVPIIMEIIKNAKSRVPDPAWYCADDEDFVKSHIKDEGFILKAVIEEVLAGFLTVRYPKRAEDNLGVYLQLPDDEMMQVAHMETAAVRPEYTGRGIQKRLMERGEEVVRETSCCHYLMATAHPENVYSVNNISKLGYEVVAEDMKYGGMPRYVFCKKI